jgi:hypothetical protein
MLTAQKSAAEAADVNVDVDAASSPADPTVSPP